MGVGLDVGLTGMWTAPGVVQLNILQFAPFVHHHIGDAVAGAQELPALGTRHMGGRQFR